jgi:surface protein
VYEVKMWGDVPRIVFGGAANVLNVVSIEQWGAIEWTSMVSAFQGTSGLVINATDTPNLSKVTDMQYMFYQTTNLTGNFSGWDTSNVTNMREVFYNAINFNQPLDSWDVSNVTSTYRMFRGATSFNQPLPSWNTSKVTEMRETFYLASSFDQELSSWNLSGIVGGYLGNMLTDSNLSTYNYNATLAAWAAHPDTKNGVTFGASPAQYGGCPALVSNAEAGIAGRNVLTPGKGRTITDGGAAP